MSPLPVRAAVVVGVERVTRLCVYACTHTRKLGLVLSVCLYALVREKEARGLPARRGWVGTGSVCRVDFVIQLLRIFRRGAGKALLMPSGKAPCSGEVFRNPDMAGVLRELGAGGKEAFYGGRIGEAIVKVLQEMGGTMTAEDLQVRGEGTRDRGRSNGAWSRGGGFNAEIQEQP